MWFAKLDERFFDLFEVQDRLSEMIVRKVAPYLHAAEMKRIRVKRPDSLEAYDLFLRAQENMHNSSRTVFETSEALFDAAIAKANGDTLDKDGCLALWEETTGKVHAGEIAKPVQITNGNRTKITNR